MKKLIKLFTSLFSKNQETVEPVREPMYTSEEGVNVNYILESPDRLKELMTYQADPKQREYVQAKIIKEKVLDSETVKLRKAVNDAWDGICLSRVTGEAQIEMANIAKADIQRQIDANEKIKKVIQQNKRV
jgi:hypothetical protein